jgi:hypothetical protein
MEVPNDRAPDPEKVEYGELPELTRALRALGSSRGGGSLQAQFFHPMVDARRRAADSRTPAARVAAFDSAELQRALDRGIDRIVNDWADKRDSARRAVRAELQERTAPYAKALSLLADSAKAALSANEATRLEAWRSWTTQLAATFLAADRCWLALRAVVEAIPRR